MDAPAEPPAVTLQSSPGLRPSSRSAAVNAFAVAMVAVSTGGQVAFYLKDFGATHRTDGLIAAFAIYSLVVVLGQLLRTTAVPLLSGGRMALTRGAFGWAVATLGLVLAAVCVLAAAPLGDVIAAASGPAGRRIAVSSLYVMAPAMGLQIAGAGFAVKGAVEGRIEAVAAAYIASAAAGPVAFFLLRGAAHEAILAWTMLSSSLVLTAGLMLATRFRVSPPPSARAVSAALLALASSLPLPASFIAMYPLTLALLPNDRPGQITLFGLAYGACSYLVGFTGQALSMTDAVALSGAAGRGLQPRRALVIRSFRYSLLLSAVGIGVAAVAGSPVLGRLLPSSSHSSNSDFGADILLLIPWLVATLALWAALPAVLAAAGRLQGRRLGAAVVGLLSLHVVAMLVGRAIAGFDGMIVAMLVAPAVFVLVGLHQTVPGTAAALSRPAAVTVALAAVGFGIPAAAARLLAGGGAIAAVLAAGVGTVSYGLLAAATYPDLVRTLTRLLRAPR
ncbi:MAG: hypothetical protein ACR2NR_17955 [Solirubrobacteraceae bacterium]